MTDLWTYEAEARAAGFSLICGVEEMERGKLLACGSRGLYFLPPDGDADALILTKKYITGQNGIVLDGWHYSTGSAFSETKLSASVCRACRKIIVEYC